MRTIQDKVIHLRNLTIIYKDYKIKAREIYSEIRLLKKEIQQELALKTAIKKRKKTIAKKRRELVFAKKSKYISFIENHDLIASYLQERKTLKWIAWKLDLDYQKLGKYCLANGLKKGKA